QLMPPQLLDSAEARFSTAITEAATASDSRTLNLARVGRARVRLALGDTVGALADAQLVPAAFEYDATYSSANARRENFVYQQINKSPFNTIAVPYRKFMYVFADTVVPGKVDSVPDPRVAVRFDSATTMFDNRHGQWVQLKYANIGAPIRLATGTEAQLLIAEIQGGPTAVGIINTLHAAAGLPPFRGTDPDSIRRQVIYERRAEFFLDGHHLADVNRFQLTLFPPAGTPYPVDAANPKGGFYGTGTRFPLPDKERCNNPNIPSTVTPACWSCASWADRPAWTRTRSSPSAPPPRRSRRPRSRCWSIPESSRGTIPSRSTSRGSSSPIRTSPGSSRCATS